MVSRPPRLFLRSIIAIVVVAGFYTFALAIAGGLFYVAYLCITSGKGLLAVKIGLPCLATGAIILWSILPRMDRFSPPGPLLRPEEQPKLFEQINKIAQAIQQAPPKEVYLVAEMNAWVAERGGFMGIGSRRVMGIGMPLLQALTVSEFRTVLAHEFGHYYGGDTKLGPWIYKTRAAIGRTLQSLDEGVIHIAFRSFGKLFLRITYAVSRYQEYVADAIAARLESASAAATGLRKIYAASLAYRAYWDNEVLPALNVGYLPPFAKGFEYFLQKEQIQKGMAASVEEELAATVSSPYGTHPALADRLKALDHNQESGVIDDRPAITVLENVPHLEKQLFTVLGGDAGKNLKTTTWASIGEDVYLPIWNTVVDRYKSALAGLATRDISDIAREPKEFVKKLEMHEERTLEEEDGKVLARQVLGVAICAALAKRGWKIGAMPGEPIKLTNEDCLFEPFKAVNDLFERKLTISDWREKCQQCGIDEIGLDS